MNTRSRLRLSALAYAIWLNAITVVFSLVGTPEALQVVLVAAAIPVALQLHLLPTNTAGTLSPLTYAWLFTLAILASLLWNIHDRMPLILLANMIWVFLIAGTIAACADDRLFRQVAAYYAALASVLLLVANLSGEVAASRLAVGALHANSWGLVAASAVAAAPASRSWALSVSTYAIGFWTVWACSARGSLVGILCALATILLITTRSRRQALARLAALVAGISLLWLAPTLREFVLDDLFRWNDPYRGVDTGLTGRVDAWVEMLDLWSGSMLFGIGFRMHEELLTALTSAHNAYLTMLTETGLVGFALYMGFLLAAARAVWRCPLSLRIAGAPMLVAYAAIGLFERRALNSGNAFSILFLISGFFVLTASNRRSLDLLVNSARVSS